MKQPRVRSDYIQFGCGTCAPPAWRNFDAGPAFWLQKRLPFLKSALVNRGYPDYPKNIEVGDIIKGLPIQQNCAKAAYCSHVLEHLTLDEFRVAIRNVHGYLQPGGLFRLVVPDLEYLAKTYVADQSSKAAIKFMSDSVLGEKHAPRGFLALPRVMFGRSRHLWMWDYAAISHELAEAGFSQIRRAFMGDSAEPCFAEVEEIGRWNDCLGVECSKK